MGETTVYRTWDESMANMAVDLLRSEGIDARMISDVPRSIYPFTFDGLGKIQIIVPEENSQDALEILAVRFSDGEVEVSGDDDLTEEEVETEEYDEAESTNEMTDENEE